MIFTKPTIDFLKKMGWSPDRCIEPASLLTSLSDEGYGLFPLIQHIKRTPNMKITNVGLRFAQPNLRANTDGAVVTIITH